MRNRILAAALAVALIAAAPISADAGPITSYPAAATPLSGSETVIGTQSGSTVQITAASIAAIVTGATNTWTGVQTFPAPGASHGSLVLTPGTATGTPPNGSIWTTSSGLDFQAGGTTQQAVGNGPNSWTGMQTFPAASGSNPSIALALGSAPSSPANGSLWATSAGLFGEFGSVAHQFADLDANTFTGEQILPASTTANASLNIGQGTGPASPVNGDIWVTASGAFARVNGVTAALGVTVPTAAAGGSNTQVQYNCSAVLCGANFTYATSGNTLTGPDGTVWNSASLTVGPGSKINLNGTALLSGSTPMIFTPQCGGGASWMIGPDPSYCSHATSSSSDNIGIGTIVFGSLTSGCCNTTAGSENMKDLTTGSNNTSFGFESLHLITTGDANTGFGNSALNQLTTGSNNVAVGSTAGGGILSGSSNVCVFSTCGAAAQLTGSNNVMVGGGGALLTSGSRNIFMGPTNNNAGYGIVTGSGNVYIGGQETLCDQSDFDHSGRRRRQHPRPVPERQRLSRDQLSGEDRRQVPADDADDRHWSLDG